MTTENKLPDALIDACGPYIDDMRDWLSDCQWGDVEADDIKDMPSHLIIRAVSMHYAGGLAAFIAAA